MGRVGDNLYTNAPEPGASESHFQASRSFSTSEDSRRIRPRVQVTPRQVVHRNLSASQLLEAAIRRNEGSIHPDGAFYAATAQRPGHSSHEKHLVRSIETSDLVLWGSEQGQNVNQFDALYAKAVEYLHQRDELFVFDAFAGNASRHRLALRFINEQAWHNLFLQELFLRAATSELADFAADYTIICAPGFKAVPAEDGTDSEAFTLLNCRKRIVLIGGARYAGEMKNSVLTVMNYLLPRKGILPMHCAAVMDAELDGTDEPERSEKAAADLVTRFQNNFKKYEVLDRFTTAAPGSPQTE